MRWCPGEDSNLHELLHWYLKPARLPVPPPGQDGSAVREAQECTHCFGACQSGPFLAFALAMLNSNHAGRRPNFRWGWVASIRQESRRFVDRIAGDRAAAA